MGKTLITWLLLISFRKNISPTTTSTTAMETSNRSGASVGKVGTSPASPRSQTDLVKWFPLFKVAVGKMSRVVKREHGFWQLWEGCIGCLHAFYLWWSYDNAVRMWTTRRIPETKQGREALKLGSGQNPRLSHAESAFNAKLIFSLRLFTS